MAIVYTVVGILGFFITDTALNILALNTADHFLHLATAAVLFVVLAQSPRTATA